MDKVRMRKMLIRLDGSMLLGGKNINNLEESLFNITRL